jgi:formylglycine-generating enzyme required for sulfatase activity
MRNFDLVRMEIPMQSGADKSGGNNIVKDATVHGDITQIIATVMSQEQTKEPSVETECEYLRATANLAFKTVLSNGEEQLARIYMPLLVNCSVTLKCKGEQLEDFWVRDLRQTNSPLHDASERLEDTKTWPAIRDLDGRLKILLKAYHSEVVLKEADDSRRKEISSGKDFEVPIVLEAQDAFLLTRCLVLVGAHGSGKSTFARHLTMSMAGWKLTLHGKEDLGNARHAFDDNRLLQALSNAPYIPLLVDLSGFVRDRTDSSGSFTVQGFWKYVKNSILKPMSLGNQGAKDVMGQLKSDNGLLIFDGFDDIGSAVSPDRREQVKEVIQRLSTQLQCRVIVLMRPQSYDQSWTADGFGRAELIGPPIADLEKLAHDYAHAREVANAGTEVDALIGAIETTKNPLYRTNPLRFVLLLRHWFNQSPDARSLPASEGALLKVTIDKLLPRTEKKEMADELGLSGDDLRSGLENLALENFVRGSKGGDALRFASRDLAAVLDDLAIDDVRPGRVRQHLEGRSVIQSLPDSPRAYRFIESVYQDYFAACALIRPRSEHNRTMPVGSSGSRFPENLVKLVKENPECWRQVAIQASNQLVLSQSAELSKLVAQLCHEYDKPMNSAASICAVGSADIALDIADRHGLLSPMPQSGWSENPLRDRLQKIAERLMRDPALPAARRVFAGRVLAYLGDTRFRSGSEGLPVAEDWGFIDFQACMYRIGTRKDDLEKISRECGLGNSNLALLESEINNDDAPVNAFSMGRYPVTVRQWQLYSQAKRVLVPKLDTETRDPAGGNAEDTYPVSSVTLREALAYCDWLTYRLKDNPEIAARFDRLYGSTWCVRLPTELQWERAARTLGSEHIWPWGNKPNSDLANYVDTLISGYSPVGCFASNSADNVCQDMIGNCWEWTRSRYGRQNGMDIVPEYAYPYRSSDGREDLTAIDEDRDYFVVRGGSFRSSLLEARIAYRGLGYAKSKNGFRVVVCA